MLDWVAAAINTLKEFNGGNLYPFIIDYYSTVLMIKNRFFNNKQIQIIFPASNY